MTVHSCSPFTVADTVHYIANCIPSPCDLLCLALVSRTCASVVLPSHIRFRVACAQDVDRSTWDYIVAQPALAQMIWKLDITIRTLLPVVDPELVAVLNTTPSVRSLSVRASSYSSSSSQFCSIRNSLLSPTSLQSLSLYGFDLNAADCKVLLQLRDLRALRLQVKVSSQTCGIVEFIFKHANLEVLDFAITVGFHRRLSVGENFRTALFPHLQTFAPRCYPACNSSEDLPVFLSKHPWIRKLTYASNVCVHLQPGTLPQLSELSTSPEFFLALMSCPVDAPRPIHCIANLDCVSLYGPRFCVDFYDSALVRQLYNVSARYVPHLNLIALAFPNLSYLHIDRAFLLPENGGNIAKMSMYEWCDFLSRFQSLEHFRGVSFFAPSSALGNQARNISALRIISQCLPFLRTVEAWSETERSATHRMCIWLAAEGHARTAALTRDSPSRAFPFPKNVFLTVAAPSDRD